MEQDTARLSKNEAGSTLSQPATLEDGTMTDQHSVPQNHSKNQKRLKILRISTDRADNDKNCQIKTQQSSKSPSGSMILKVNMSNIAEPANNKVHTQMMGTMYSK